MLTHPNLNDPSVTYGFFGRRGGVSAGIYDSLNCGFGSNDDGGRVAENRRRVLHKMGLANTPLMTLYQVHSNRVAIADTIWDSDKIVEADGMVTRRSGIVLGIMTADCTPVLLHDPTGGVIGACHAGWRGAKAGILDNTVAEMVDLGATLETIRAVIGPTIGAQSYEVSDDFKADFLTDDGACEKFFSPGTREGHPMFDLPAYVAARLEGLGIASVGDVAVDTLTQSQNYFSYRDSQRRGHDDYGRNLSVIALRADR